MKELQDQIVEAFQRNLDAKKFDEILDKKMAAFFSNVVDDALSSWGDFSKALKRKLSDDLLLNIGNIDLANYNAELLNRLNLIIQRDYQGFFLEKISQSVERIFEKPPARIKLSELIKQFIDAEVENHSDGGEISFYFERTADLRWVYFDPEPNKKDYECKYRIYSDKEGEISNVQIRNWGGRISFKNPEPLSNKLFGFDALLFRLYSWGSTIEMDDHRVVTEYGGTDD